MKKNADPALLPALADADVYTVAEAATALRVGQAVIREAIKSKQLVAFIIGGRAPLRAGRGLGYRIKRADLQAWYFGDREEGDAP